MPPHFTLSGWLCLTNQQLLQPLTCTTLPGGGKSTLLKALAGKSDANVKARPISIHQHDLSAFQSMNNAASSAAAQRAAAFAACSLLPALLAQGSAAGCDVPDAAAASDNGCLQGNCRLVEMEDQSDT